MSASIGGATNEGRMMEVIRQGDVLLIPIERGDPRYIGVTRRSGTSLGREDTDEGSVIVLAHGEATGHHHHVKSRKAVMRSQAISGRRTPRRRILHVGHEGATLEHQEHSPIALAPGRYEVVRQTEYVPPKVERKQSTSTAPRPEVRRNVWD